MDGQALIAESGEFGSAATVWISFLCSLVRKDTLGNIQGYKRRAGDLGCHAMWSDKGSQMRYHGDYENGSAMAGKYELSFVCCWEIVFPAD